MHSRIPAVAQRRRLPTNHVIKADITKVRFVGRVKALSNVLQRLGPMKRSRTITSLSQQERARVIRVCNTVRTDDHMAKVARM